MLKNKKGFTLVELMATLGILVLMGTIIGVNIVSILRSTEDLNKNNAKELIEEAACVFVDSSLATKKSEFSYTGTYSIGQRSGSVYVSDLIKCGLIPDSLSTEYGSKTVSISTVSQAKKCTLN